QAAASTHRHGEEMTMITVRFKDKDHTIEEARERLVEIEQEMRAVDEEAGDGDLDEEQQETWRSLDADAQELGRLLRKAERRQRRAESRAKWGSVQVGGRKEDPFDADPRVMPEPQALSRARQILDAEEHTSHLRDEQKVKLSKA